MEAFFAACINGDEPAVRLQLASNPGLANSRGRVRPDHREFMSRQDADNGWTALHLAAHYGQLGVVRLLLAAGADIRALADNAIGNTPLMAAIAGGNEAIVRELLAAGADPRQRDRSSRHDAWTLAQAGGRADLAALVKEALARVR